METPKPLLTVLMRKLKDQEPLSPPTLAPATSPVAAPTPKPTPKPSPKPSSTPTAKPSPAPKPADSGGLVVQAAAFSTRDRADKAATAIGGKVSQHGRFWRMQIGPFATRAEAEAALAKVKAAGYSDARIQRATD